MNGTASTGGQGRFATPVTVGAANPSRLAIRKPRDRCGFAATRSVDDFEAVATAAALPFDKARSNRRDERRPVATRLTIQRPGVFCGLPNNVVGDTTLTCRSQGDIQSQNRDFLQNRGFAALHLDKQPKRASPGRIALRLHEHGLLVGPGAAHGYPD